MTELWRQLRWFRAAASPKRRLVEIGTAPDGCLAVEDEMLVSAAAIALLDPAEVDRWEDVTPDAWAGIGLRHVQLNGREAVEAAVPRLRALVEEAAGAAFDPQVHRVTYNHALSGEPFYRGGPGAAPVDAPAGWARPIPFRDLPPIVAVLDTGFAPEDGAELAPGVHSDVPADVDELRFNGEKWLGAEAGHGTFVAGLVLRFSDGVPVRCVKVLDPDGWGEESAIITAVLELVDDKRIQVVNLSLGGYTEGDERPPLCDALQQLPDHVAVVAAAGNNGSDRAFWPAADERTIAVAALEDDLAGLTPFSNSGSWLSTAATGRDLLSVGVRGTYLVDDGVEEHLRGWTSWSGTSFAAPLVAAEIARRVVDQGIDGTAAWSQLVQELELSGGKKPWGVTHDARAFGNGLDPSGV